MNELTPETIKQFALARWNELAPEKFDKGQAEHGGLLTNRDCIAEMEKEVIDFWFYLQAFRQKRQAIEDCEAAINRFRLSQRSLDSVEREAIAELSEQAA